MSEINTLKAQKQSIMKDMVNAKKNQMEEDHKLFQQKLEELKNSMIQPQPAVHTNSMQAKGDEILKELDRMRERLRQGKREEPVVHPSDRTRKNIVIDNPLAEKQIDPSDYRPLYKHRSFNELEQSLPGQTALKVGLNNSQNFRSFREESINERESEHNPEDDKMNMQSPERRPFKKNKSRKDKSPTKTANKEKQSKDKLGRNKHIK